MEVAKLIVSQAKGVDVLAQVSVNSFLVSDVCDLRVSIFFDFHSVSIFIILCVLVVLNIVDVYSSMICATVLLA